MVVNTRGPGFETRERDDLVLCRCHDFAHRCENHSAPPPGGLVLTCRLVRGAPDGNER